MKLLPINETVEGNADFLSDPRCEPTLQMTLDFYGRVGFEPPWICYYASEDGDLVGNAAYKGAPKEGKVEIAYATFEDLRHRGVGTRICAELVRLAMEADANVRITARTLPERNHSTRILEKNNFQLLGTVNDPEDGEVWEWEYNR